MGSTTIVHAQSAAISSMDPIVLAALIGGIGAFLAALTAGIFMIYQIRHTARIEQKRQEEQSRHEAEMARLHHEVARHFKAKERDEQTEAEKAENLRRATLLAKTNEERSKIYRKSLHADPHISCLQILSMSRPLEITNVYIRVRLHEETRPNYELFPALLAAERERDPNMLLKMNQKFLESRSSSALDPDEAIRRFRHCVVVGDPGAGKTTLLKYLALRSADQALSGLPDLPIHISLNDFVNSECRDLLDFAAKTWDERYGFPERDARAYMEDRLQQGQAMLLLDALDETVAGDTTQAAEASYKSVTNAIVHAKTRYNQSPIVVTARKAGYHAHPPLVGFTEIEVLDFRQEDIEQFIMKWFATYEGSQKQGSATDLNGRLKRNPRIQALAANPLLLSLIVLVYQKQLELPDRRAELYKRCIEILLTEWDASRGIQRRREFKPEYKQQLLEGLAWHFHQQGLRYFRDEEVWEEIATFLPTVNLPPEENRNVLTEIASENGLLKEQAQGWHGFLHLTLQEYFVARYITDHQKLEILLAHRGDPWWEEVFQLYAGQVPDASPLLHQLLEQKNGKQEQLPEDIFHTNLIAAGQCIVARPTIQQIALRGQIISRLFDLLTSTPYSLLRNQIAETLAAIGGKEANNLLHLLADPHINVSVCQSIATAFGKVGDRSVVPDLLRLLADPQIDASVCRDIATALGKVGDRSVVPDLLRLLADPQIDSSNSWGPSVRESIARTFGELGDRSVVPDLLRLLTDPQIDGSNSWGPSVRQSIATTLGELGDRSVVPDLLRLLANPNIDTSVRQSIATVLEELGDRSVVPDLLRLLADPNIDLSIKSYIALTLVKLKDQSVIPGLLRLLADPQIDSFVRQSIATTLGELGDRSVVPDLLRLLADPQIDGSNSWGPFVRQSIATTLGELGDRSVVPDLLRLLADPNIDLSIKSYIALTLVKLKDQSVIPGLLRLLADPQIDSVVRESIARTFGELGDRSVVPDLLRLLADPQIGGSNAWGDPSSVGKSIAIALQSLAHKKEDIEFIANLLLKSEKNDAGYLYETLWIISRRARVRVLIRDEPMGKHIEIVGW